MRIYLDPKMYIYDAQVWQSRAFEPRLLALVEILNEIVEAEKKTNLSGKIVRFRTSPDLQEVMFRNNPTINMPPISGHYLRLFQNKVLPELYKRSDSCPEAICNFQNSMPAAPQPSAVYEDEIQILFRSLLEMCGICGHKAKRSLLYYGIDTSLSLPDSYFDREIDVSTSSWMAALECSNYFPDSNDAQYREQKLIFAIKALFSYLVFEDSSWKNTTQGSVLFSKYFWDSVSRADFRGEERLHHAKILHTLVQIIFNRDLNIEAHSMSPQKINHAGKEYFKWNAYVFKMGSSAIDTRCSRIYYARIANEILINEYNPDAH